MSPRASSRGFARVVALAALAAAPLLVGAADDEPVKQPYIEVGDCWSFRGENLTHRSPIREYEECVTFVDRDKDVVFAVAKVKGDDREIDTSYTLSMASRTNLEGTITTYAKGQEALKWPVRVGDTHTFWSEFRRALLGRNAGKTTWNVRIVGWEEVTVPAGKFRALKIEGDGVVERYDIRDSFPVKFASWYVPEIGRAVKSWFQNPDGRRGVELTGFKLNK